MTLTFVSPISGTVLQKNVVEGQYVEEGTELYLLADLSQVWMIAQVYEFELGRLRNGQPALVTTSAYAGCARRPRRKFSTASCRRTTPRWSSGWKMPAR